jgi:hypothetical protein
MIIISNIWNIGNGSGSEFCDDFEDLVKDYIQEDEKKGFKYYDKCGNEVIHKKQEKEEFKFDATKEFTYYDKYGNKIVYRPIDRIIPNESEDDWIGYDIDDSN